MKGIKSICNRMFPLMALTGLFLAGWALIITPEEIKGGQEIPHWSWK